MAQAEWSELPGEILLVIFQKLKDPSDIYRCGLVCVSWKFVVRTVLPHCLLLSNVGILRDERGRLHFEESVGKQSCILFNTQTSETHEISLPEIEGRWFCSSSFGWLLTIGLKTPHRVRLLNPFTCDQIELPSAREFERPHKLRVVTSTNPLSAKCLVLAAHQYQLAFCRPGDESWTRVQYFDGLCSDTIFYNNKFYAVDFDGDLFRISCNIIPIAAKLPLRPVIWTKRKLCLHHNYLVELDGKLLLIARYHYETNLLVQTCAFEVFELNWVEKVWIKVESIGNNVILLGINSSISLRVGPFRNFKANCIYFIDDNDIKPPMNKDNTGFYDITTGQTEYLYHSSAIWTSPLNWFIPTLLDTYKEKISEAACGEKGAGVKSWSSRILTSLQNFFSTNL